MLFFGGMKKKNSEIAFVCARVRRGAHALDYQFVAVASDTRKQMKNVTVAARTPFKIKYHQTYS